MIIKTITCHEVYNHGASLQEYALLKYLQNEGHDAETIHYKPDYLSNHFKLWIVTNDRYEKNIFLKLAYLILKLPGRLISFKRKKNFDLFSNKYIKSTSKLYRTNEEIKNDLPNAEAYICGSDQIWNSFFQNGKDPAFYLDFVPVDKLKFSYAASFAIDKLEENIKDFVKDKVTKLDHISVRESSGKEILADLGFNNVTHVLDPVFLLDSSEWEEMSAPAINESYIFVYDCDSDPLIFKFVKKMQKQFNYKIVTVNKNITYADMDFSLEGPAMFLSLVQHAKFVVSNSFHAVAFSIIFQKQFTVFNRFEKINTRMRDFVNLFNISEVLILNDKQIQNFEYKIDYKKVYIQLLTHIKDSKGYLNRVLANE